MKGLKKAGGNWVDGDRFFDREFDLEALGERVREGHHTLLTAQRRMGKTSLVRELLRRLADEGSFETIFVDLEGAHDSADAVAEIAIQARSVRTVWSRIKSGFSNFLEGIGDRVEALEVADVKVRLRAGIDAGNWRQRGDQIFTALSLSEKPVVLAIDELPILINRLLKGQDYRITPDRRETADQFLSWLRKNGQTYRGRVSIIVSGSVGLEPILKQAGLSAQANIFSPFELRPWSPEISIKCLEALACTYGLDLSRDVRWEMCRRLRCCVPHHVQQFFDHLHEHLRRNKRYVATLADVGHVYEQDLLSVRGQIDLEHYESRLRMILGSENYKTALSPDYSWDMLIRASNPAFSCGRSPGSLEPLSIRPNRLKNRTIEPVINRLPARGTVTRRQVDFPERNPHRFGPFHGPDFSSVHYPGAQDTRASLCHNRFQSVAPWLMTKINRLP